MATAEFHNSKAAQELLPQKGSPAQRVTAEKLPDEAQGIMKGLASRLQSLLAPVKRESLSPKMQVLFDVDQAMKEQESALLQEMTNTKSKLLQWASQRPQYSLARVMQLVTLIGVSLGVGHIANQKLVVEPAQARRLETDTLVKRASNPFEFSDPNKTHERPRQLFNDASNISQSLDGPPESVRMAEVLVLLRRGLLQYSEINDPSDPNSSARLLHEAKGAMVVDDPENPGKVKSMLKATDKEFREVVEPALRKYADTHADDPRIPELAEDVLANLEEQKLFENLVADAQKWAARGLENPKPETEKLRRHRAKLGEEPDSPIDQVHCFIKMFEDLQAAQARNPKATYRSMGIPLDDVIAKLEELITHYGRPDAYPFPTKLAMSSLITGLSGLKAEKNSVSGVAEVAGK